MFSKSLDPLFHSGDLVATLDQHLRSVEDRVTKIPKDQFMILSDNEIVEHIQSKMHVEAIVLLDDRKSMEQEEIQIDARGYTDRYISDRSKPFPIPGIRVTVTIPYTGDEQLWKLKPSHWTSVLPHGIV